MKTATVHGLKKEMAHLPKEEIMELCLRLARFKKENKELLTYLLFEAGDEDTYIESVKAEMDEQFAAINTFLSLYISKKSVRKILRFTLKYIRYTGSKKVEAELLIHFCTKLKKSKIAFRQSTTLLNLYESQLRKIIKAVEGMHEDLQYDYVEKVAELGG